MQAYLDSVNSAQRIGHEDTAFLVYTDSKGENVIGEQYMWHYVYPLINAWVENDLCSWLPCEPHLYITNCCSAGTMTKKSNGDTLGYRSMTFAQDFPIIQTADELKAQFPKLKLSVKGYIPETLTPDFTQITLDNKDGKLKAAYPFAGFHMSIWQIAEAEWQTLTQKPGLSTLHLWRDGDEICRVEYNT